MRKGQCRTPSPSKGKTETKFGDVLVKILVLVKFKLGGSSHCIDDGDWWIQTMVNNKAIEMWKVILKQTDQVARM